MEPSEEIHAVMEGDKLWQHSCAVRYPNDKTNKHTCIGVVYGYTESRWKVYVSEYARLVNLTPAFLKLKEMLNSGIDLELLDVDCPDSIEITIENFNSYLNNPNMSFGHTWTLAAC